MLKLSKFPFHTLKSDPKVSDNRSTSLLLKGSYIRQTMAGVYEYLPMGFKVLRNIENIVREEMDKAGYHEMLMSILTPKSFWETTNRRNIEDYFSLQGHGDSWFRIAPTNEENVTPIMKEFIESYKDLPNCVYHIQKKFRNEKRAKSGLLRGREFIMKDAYSFHSELSEFDEFYEEVKKVYTKIYERLGIGKDTIIAEADGGAISDKPSHEFQTFLEIGEDVIVFDSLGNYANLELASGIPDDKNSSETSQKLELIDSIPEIVNMEKMTNYFGAPDWQMLKTVIYKLENGKFIGISLRGDLEINEIKVRKFLKEKYSVSKFELACEEDLISIGTVRGFVSPLKNSSLKNIDFYGDNSLKTVKNFFGGNNSLAKSSKNVNLEDLDLISIEDFNVPILGFTSKNVLGEKLQFKRACEVGNIFYLADKYTKPFGLTYLNANNETVSVNHMGCYGLGVSRVMGVLAEYFMTEKGIAWPENIAPATHFVLILGEENLQKGYEIAEKLESEGKTVIVDDRISKKIGYGQKFADAELWGIPNIISVTPKTVESGNFEVEKVFKD